MKMTVNIFRRSIVFDFIHLWVNQYIVISLINVRIFFDNLSRLLQIKVINTKTMDIFRLN